MDFILKAVAVVAPIIAIAVFALPSYVGVLRQRGFLRGIFILLLLSAYAFSVYTALTKTGFPSGNFTYASVLGHKIFGITPWVLVFAYPPILLTAFWLSSKFSRSLGRVILCALSATLILTVLEPASVRLQLWNWAEAGNFYGVPPLLFVGWAIVSLLGAFLLHLVWGKDVPVRASVAYSGLAVLLFWTGANIGVEQWVPAGLGGLQALVVMVILLVEKKQINKQGNSSD